MNDITANRLASLVTDALERTAFVMADPMEPEQAEAYPAITHAACITYHGPSVGEVRLEASQGFAVELAASLLGVEPTDVSADDEGASALRELANIVGGSIILALGGDDCEYSLGLPESLPSPVTPDTSSTVCLLDAEDEPLRVSWIPRAA